MKKTKTKSKLKIDELHRIGFKEFFGKMYISPEQMNTRIELAGQIEDIMLYVFAYWSIAASAGLTINETNEAEIRQDAKDKMRLVLARHTKLDPYLETHIDKTVDEIIDSTIKHVGNDADSEPYWTSTERAMLISENEANAFENYVEYRDAVTSGKTKKKWITENDEKVRLTHEIAEGQTVDIDGLFLVGDSLMRFPMDTSNDPDPREIINCRCSVVYE